MARRKRILFVAEAVSLAHVTRPLKLAESLSPENYEVHFACANHYDFLFENAPTPRRDIKSISPACFLERLSKGKPIYDYLTLLEYVDQDLALLHEVHPDLVVGDFRITLAVSARLAGVPYATLTNAYWSPYARQKFPLPELPIVQALGVSAAQAIFKLVRPIAFAYHTLPINRLCKRHGLRAIGPDLRRVYTEADYTLYADLPSLIPTYRLPDNHLYIGPVVWSPTHAYPAWWDQLPTSRPNIYVTLGSSGRSELLEVLLSALGDEPYEVLAATAGRVSPSDVPHNAHLADYLPGTEAAARAKLVICNGGSPTTSQALAGGSPVLGIASNMDQYLNMSYLQRAGVGLTIRAGLARRGKVKTAVSEILGDSSFEVAATQLSENFRAFNASERFSAFLQKI